MGRKRSCPPSTYLLPEQGGPVSAPGCSQNTSGWGPTPRAISQGEQNSAHPPRDTARSGPPATCLADPNLHNSSHSAPRPLLILSSHREAICPPQSYLPSGSSSALPSSEGSTHAIPQEPSQACWVTLRTLPLTPKHLCT